MGDMKIILKSKYKKNIDERSGYMKTGNFQNYCTILVHYQKRPEIIREIQDVLLKHFDLIEEQRGRLSPSAIHNPHFNSFLDKRVKVFRWNYKKGRQELVSIKEL